jgi:hypothetical protein
VVVPDTGQDFSKFLKSRQDVKTLDNVMLNLRPFFGDKLAGF